MPPARLPLTLPNALFTRRHVIAAGGAALAASVLPAQAQTGAIPAEGAAFDFDTLTGWMRALAETPYAAPARVEGFSATLDYDSYRRIRFRRERTRWLGHGTTAAQPEPGAAADFGLQAFHVGWLFGEPVRVFDVSDGTLRMMHFSTADFEYDADLGVEVPAETELPGVAGFRLLWPLNAPGVQDEVVAFLGASYFRALGQGSRYGISARGLAINTGLGRPEEFPRFSDFFLSRPDPDAPEITIMAALDSESVTGACRIMVRPGRTTAMDVTMRLFFRADVEHLGVAPLTSMFLYDDKNRAAFDDYRPRVHDSDGLAILRRDGIRLWRPLNNPASVANSFFADPVARFGLHQRERAFDAYQDTEARYELRPSLDVEPLGDWGPGAVRLVEIPSRLEGNDNIVAFFVPGDGRAAAGEARDYAYRLLWGNAGQDDPAVLARVVATRGGHGGVAGLEPEPDLRKFVIDFSGPGLPPAPDHPDTPLPVTAVVTCTGGEIETQVLKPLPDGTGWRLVIDVRAAAGDLAEMTAHLTGAGARLSETWVHQWVNAA